ncbi:MAG: response regulator [SAR324 cluster bacterium]|nr:response regulator [SAR324 cluster bacterium]
MKKLPLILIIDDETDIWDVISHALKRESVELIFAKNGKEGLELFYERKPLVVLLDLRMPVMNGMRFLETLQPKHSDPYSVLVLTGHGDDEEVKICYQSGVHGFLRKPINVFELRGLLLQTIELKQAQVDLKNQFEQLRQLQLEKDQESHRLADEQDISGFFSSVFYLFVLANLEERSVDEILESAEDFLKNEMKLDVVLMLDSEKSNSVFQEGEQELLLRAVISGESITRLEQAFICYVPPLAVLVRDQVNIDQDKIQTFVSAAASRLLFAIAEENKRIMNRILEEAIFMVNSRGKIEPGFSDVCLSMFQIKDREQFIEMLPGELLFGKNAKAEQFFEWLQLCYNSFLDFDDLVAVQPSELLTEEGRCLSLKMSPVYNNDRQLHFILFKLTDITEQKLQRAKVTEEEEHNAMIIKVASDQEGFLQLLDEVEMLFLEIYGELSLPEEELNIQKLFRYFHTLKGGTASYGMKRVAAAFHELENQLTLFQDSFQSIDLIFISQMLNNTNEVQALYNQTLEYLNAFIPQAPGKSREKNYKVSELKVKKVEEAAARILPIPLLQPILIEVDRLRMEPIGSRFKRLVFMVEELSTRFNKLVEVKLVGTDLEVHIEPLRYFLGTLVHLIRNCVDHGIEEPETRIRNGKPETGTITIKTFKEGNLLKISIADDGKGIDVRTLARIALEKKLMNEEALEAATEQDLLQLIFAAGFSTKEEISDISGRGVGMGAIKSAVEALRGSISIISTLGEGTTFEIAIPHF